MSKTKNYSLGAWVQNCHSFANLRKVVEVFFSGSENNLYLINTKIPQIVEDSDIKNQILSHLKKPINIPLHVLKGTAFYPRSNAKCNGIVQAAIDGQRRPFVDDWTSINFIKWAVLCNFISYDEALQTCNITPLGEQLCQTERDSEEENELLKLGLSTYPPIFRILSLLEQNIQKPLTKFELGKNLGFTNEAGFTSYPFEVLAQSFDGLSKSAINKLKTDCEGTSDKYARDICSWLLSLKLIKETPIVINSVSIGAYSINSNGIKYLNQIRGNSSNKKIVKHIPLSMLGFGIKGDNDKNTEYIRFRRGTLLGNVLKNATKALTINEICSDLVCYNINEPSNIIINDINGLINIGIDIETFNGSYKLNDKIIVPNIINRKIVKHKDVVQERHDKILSLVSEPIQKHSQLILLAHEGKNNKLFESGVMDLLLNVAKFDGKYLGGASRPDGIIIFDYENELNEKRKLGVLLDQKAYEDGYNVPIGQSDAMSRYIEEYQKKDVLLNKNCWWESFPCDELSFCFISGEFNGEFNNKINRISISRNVSGSVITIDNLLLLCDKLIQNKITKKEVAKLFTSGKEIVL
jgi:Restriction endonuclease FokI, C terminal/Restriction endonuclease FokI, recognition domain/Restriction endonuclease FokI, catalytic domain/Type-2 restriction enzyme D3 domain